MEGMLTVYTVHSPSVLPAASRLVSVTPLQHGIRKLNCMSRLTCKMVPQLHMQACCTPDRLCLLRPSLMSSSSSGSSPCAVVIFARTSPLAAATSSSKISLMRYRCFSLLFVARTSTCARFDCQRMLCIGVMANLQQCDKSYQRSAL